VEQQRDLYNLSLQRVAVCKSMQEIPLLDPRFAAYTLSEETRSLTA
jgi:hypothetical protein